MRILLDTHILMWWFLTPDRISNPAHEILSDRLNTVFASTASVWEMAIKKAKGKLDVPTNLEIVMAEEGFRPLDVTMRHAFAAAELPDFHGDPFDRMLIAQAKVEKLTLATRDRRALRYEIDVLLT